jgi:CHASE2 domain-containing sensor protein
MSLIYGKIIQYQMVNQRLKKEDIMKKKEILKIWSIILMILLLIAAFTLFFLGHYSKAFILLGIFVLILSFISNWLEIGNEVYLHEKNFKNHHR